MAVKFGNPNSSASVVPLTPVQLMPRPVMVESLRRQQHSNNYEAGSTTLLFGGLS